MNRWKLQTIGVLASTTLLLVGCDQSESGSAGEGAAQNQPSAGDVAREAEDAAATTAAFAQSQIEAYKDQARAGLETVDASIATLADRAARLSGDAQAEAQEALEQLREQRAAFVNSLEDASADTAEAWSDVRSGLERAFNDLEAAAGDAVERFGEPE